MPFLISNIKKIYKSQFVGIAISLFLVIAVCEPLFIHNDTATLQELGEHPFAYWLLMYSGVGQKLYYALLFVFPVISTGFVYFYEQSTSVYSALITRKSSKSYFGAMLIATFATTFINFFVILMANITITYTRFSSLASTGEHFLKLIPKEISFAYLFYLISPLAMSIMYAALNAFTIAILSLLSLGIQMVCKFRQLYLAFLVPVVSLNFLSYSLSLFKPKSSFLIILQPRIAGMNRASRVSDVLVIYLILTVLTALILFIGWRRNREVL